MTSQQLLQDLIKRLALKYELPENMVRRMTRAPFEVLIKAMKEGNRETGEFPSVRIPNWGLFYAPAHRVEFFKTLKRKKNYAPILNGESESSDKS